MGLNRKNALFLVKILDILPYSAIQCFPNMNKSERSYIQGYREQIMTPELKLSMELRGTCERLLQEHGRNNFSYQNAALHLPPFLLFVPLRYLIYRSTPSELLFSREVKMGHKKKDNKPDIIITSRGFYLNKAKRIEVEAKGLEERVYREGKEPQATWLELLKEGKTTIVTYYPTRDIRNPIDRRRATIEELQAYQRYIGESSPIEYK